MTDTVQVLYNRSKKEIFSLEELSEWVLLNTRNIFHWSDEKCVFIHFDANYRDHVSNSHNAPKGKRSNFSRDDSRPTGFPGWAGRIWCVFDRNPDLNASRHLSDVGIHPGTGGYGWYGLPDGYRKEIVKEYPNCYPLSWDVKVFQEDWPMLGLTEKLES